MDVAASTRPIPLTMAAACWFLIQIALVYIHESGNAPGLTWLNGQFLPEIFNHHFTHAEGKQPVDI